MLDISAHAEQYFNPPRNHPSQPNYLCLEAGTNFAVLADIGAAIEEGRYISLDADDMLSIFMVNGSLDPVQFMKSAGDLIVRAAKAVNGEHARVAACGTSAPLLWEQGNADGAIQLERLWDQIARSHGVDVLCGYSLATFQGGIGSHVFEKICATHSAVHSR